MDTAAIRVNTQRRRTISSGLRISMTDMSNIYRIKVVALCLCLGFASSCIGASGKVTDYKVKVLQTYRHDKSAYTQGLFFWNGGFYETTGQYGSSSLRKVDLQSGKVLQQKNFGRKYFGEGSCVVGDNLYILTWTNKVAFVYDPVSFEYRKTLSYPREGWGLAALPKKEGDAVMVASDGSSNLYFLDEKLQTKRTLKVTFDGRPIKLLNELEYIDGKIWANIYTTDMIVIIDPATGKVEGRIDCSSLIPSNKRTPDMDVLNGIAADPQGNIYLTGKNWPSLFRIQLVK